MLVCLWEGGVFHTLLLGIEFNVPFLESNLVIFITFLFF